MTNQATMGITKYCPPHMRTRVGQTEHLEEYLCYSTNLPFYNGRGGFETRPTSMKAMLQNNNRMLYKAIVRADIQKIWSSKPDCINGFHWTITGPAIDIIFERLTLLFAKKNMPYDTQGVKFIPKGRSYKVQVWGGERASHQEMCCFLSNVLQSFEFHANCIQNLDWANKRHACQCISIAELSQQLRLN